MKRLIIIAASVIIIFMLGMITISEIRYTQLRMAQKVEAAVTECEANLPRSQHCEPIYSAKVIKE